MARSARGKLTHGPIGYSKADVHDPISYIRKSTDRLLQMQNAKNAWLDRQEQSGCIDGSGRVKSTHVMIEYRRTLDQQLEIDVLNDRVQNK